MRKGSSRLRLGPPTHSLMRAARAAAHPCMLASTDERPPVARGITTFSVAVLPTIMFAGSLLTATAGELLISPSRHPLELAASMLQHRQDHGGTFYLAAAADDFLSDLRDSPAARTLALPPSEQRREAALQGLEDDRLERCRDTGAFTFDQCFFFGSKDSIDQRRPMEGAGSLSLGSATADRVAGAETPGSGGRPALRIPTW